MSALNRDFILNEWVPALRSGEYTQGVGSLRDMHDNYCCLGVAVDVLRRQGVIPGDWKPKDIEYAFGADDDTEYLPQPVAEYIGLNYAGSLPASRSYVGVRYLWLAHANDAHVPFSVIADWLEAAASDAGVSS